MAKIWKTDIIKYCDNLEQPDLLYIAWDIIYKLAQHLYKLFGTT